MSARRIACAAAIAVAAVACAPSHGAKYPGAFADAQRAETAGRYAEAAAKYDAAASVAIRDRDRDHARYTAGLMLLRAGNARDGVARLDEIAAASPATESSALAAYQAASARIEAGDVERGWREMEQVLARFASNGIAHAALRRVVAHKGESDKRAALTWLRAQASGPMGSSGLGELVAYEIAEHLRALEDWSGAHDQYVATATRWPYPHGALWDDSLWGASEMDEKLARPAHAIADLERMLAERETTSLVGSYQRPRMSPALFRIGVIYSGMRDHEKARAAFHRLYTEFTTSKLRADALWFEAALWAEDGDTKTSCARLETLAGDFPDSRYVPCAVEKCPTIKPSEKSKAPKACHPYLTRPGRLPS